MKSEREKRIREFIVGEIGKCDEALLDQISDQIDRSLIRAEARKSASIKLFENARGSIRGRPCENDPSSCHVEFFDENGNMLTAPSDAHRLVQAVFQHEFRGRLK